MVEYNESIDEIIAFLKSYKGDWVRGSLWTFPGGKELPEESRQELLNIMEGELGEEYSEMPGTAFPKFEKRMQEAVFDYGSNGLIRNIYEAVVSSDKSYKKYTKPGPDELDIDSSEAKRLSRVILNNMTKRDLIDLVIEFPIL